MSRIEALNLVGEGDYSITLSNELVRTSDDFGSRIFSVFTDASRRGLPFVADDAGNVTLDLSFLSPVDLDGELVSIRYFGQDDTDTERVIIRDGLISDQTRLAYGEAPLDADETFADVLQIVDTADVTKDDLIFVTGLEVIELASSVNGPQTFTFDFRNFTLAQFNALVGDPTDVLIIRATPLLAGAVSQLNIDLTGAAAGISGRIRIEQSADLNVSVIADPGFLVPITTALFYTPNPDNLQGTGGSDTFTAFQVSDVQNADTANGQGGIDTLDLRFAVSNPSATLRSQLDATDINSIEIFRFNPAAVNQAVQLLGIGAGFTGLESIFTSGGNDLLGDVDRSLFINTGAGNDSVDIDEQCTVVTGLGNDSVLGSQFADVIDTGAGQDTVSAQEGDDFVDAGAGDDLVFGLAGEDTILGGQGNNTLDGGTGDDSIFAGAGNDSIDSGDGDDTIGAGDGANTVFAGFGFDSVVTGSGNDLIRTASGPEDEDDTVRSGAGNDTVLVGLGEDAVTAAEGNDLIVLGSSFSTGSGGKIHTGAIDGFSGGDRINGGDGIDTLVFGMGVGTLETVTGTQVQNVEVINVAVEDFTTLILDTSLLPLPAGGRLAVNLEGYILADGEDFILDATSFVQGQALDVFTTGLSDDIFSIIGSSYFFGAGDDTFSNFSGGASDNVTVAGNGGSDTINLVSDLVSDDENSTIIYNTGNDGGQGGTGTGGDFITGYIAAEDEISIRNGLLNGLGGILNSDVENTTLTLGGLNAYDTVFPFGGDIRLGDNILSLTGPARSLTDLELRDASVVAANINDVGVNGNGINIGDTLFGDYLVDSVTNQALIVQQGQTETALYLYIESSFNFEVAQSYTVQANELRQLGVFSNALFTGDELV